MKEFNYVTNNEIAVKSSANAVTLAELLLDEGYVVMISKEEHHYIVNYIWSPDNANRNDVCFQSREETEDFIFNNEE
jgi:hypothetical protein